MLQRHRAHFLVFAACAASFCLLQEVAHAADPFLGADPAWNLIHEPAVERELKLSPAKSKEFRAVLDKFDATFFPLRNKPSAEAAQGVANTLAKLTTTLEGMLSEGQLQRLVEIQARQLGTRALLQPRLMELLDYTPGQKEQLEEAISETRAATTKLEEQAAKGEPRGPLEKQYAALKADELRAVLGILSPVQQSRWRRFLGRDFDFTNLGQARFKAPELVDSGEWLNTEQPLTIAMLRGKVVVIHFYAFGCINCIRNFPTYLDWQKRFRSRDVVILGIHTPETTAEQYTASVREKANEAGFTFPVLVDREKANWNAWGNSMWPSVYLLDKHGYLRHFWPGELKWEGATGDKWMQDRIEELLAEPSHVVDRP